jgi:hypothetical protein
VRYTVTQLHSYAVTPLYHYDYICLISNSTSYGNHIPRFQSVQLCFMPVLIFLARICDMSIDTLRIIFVSKGKKEKEKDRKHMT